MLLSDDNFKYIFVIFQSTLVEKSDLVNELNKLIQNIKSQASEFEAQCVLPLESQKLSNYSKNFEKLHGEIYDNESKIIILK